MTKLLVGGFGATACSHERDTKHAWSRRRAFDARINGAVLGLSRRDLQLVSNHGFLALTAVATQFVLALATPGTACRYSKDRCIW